jgi:hypothetical protein
MIASASTNALSGAISDGLSTTVQPARARRDLQRDLVERIVPRRDGRDHADRLAHDQRIADRSSNANSLASFA